jgi:ABC-2 type transport system permease protein
MNFQAIKSIYNFEMSRMWRTITQSLASPVISTCLYFIVFGSTIGSKISEVDGVSYAAYIVPGLIMLSVLTQSISNASFGIYFPRFSGTIYEVLSAPISYIEILFGYVGAAASKSFILGTVIFITARLFVDFNVEYPLLMILFFILTCITFSLIGFVIGILAESFEQLEIFPSLVITPLTFLGGSFYSINMLPEFWQKVSLLNPVIYLVNGFRWSFYGKSDLSPSVSGIMISVFLIISLLAIRWIFKTGYRLKA